MKATRAGIVLDPPCGTRVPTPPGTMRTSMSAGGLSKVCVGTTLWPNRLLSLLGAEGAVDTGRRS